MTVRVFLIPKGVENGERTNYLFHEVDSFPYSVDNCSWNKFHTDLSAFIKHKKYYNSNESYLVMGESYAFNLNYKGGHCGF